MLLWVTRPSAWDVYVKGIGRCEVWCSKPTYNPEPQGERDHPLFAHHPIGWVAYDDLGMELTQCSGQLRSLTRGHEVTEEIARKVLLDVDPTINFDTFDYHRNWSDRILEINNDPAQRKRETEFCIEVEFHPDTWIEIMERAIAKPHVEYVAWLQRVYKSDLPF